MATKQTMKDVAVIIPAYNEEQRVADVVKGVQKEGYDPIVVDDGSKDRTGDAALKAGATLLTHIMNQGKGAAMKTGAEYALSQGAKIILYIDGDGQHETHDIPKFITALETHDIAFGARRQRKGSMPTPLRLGNWFFKRLMAFLSGMDLRDPLNGFRAFHARVYPQIVWRSNDYTVESEMIAWTGKAGLKYTEVPVKTIYFDKYKGTTPLHGFPILWNLLMWRFQKHRTERKNICITM